MKKLAILAFSVLFGANSAFAIDTSTLSGKAKTACEVILCLAASGGRPGECKEPLKEYFSIKGDMHHDAIYYRTQLLQKCPDGGSNGDKNYDSLKSTLEEQDYDCTAEEFNKEVRAERRSGGDGIDSSIRTMTAVPDFCTKLAKEEYSILELPKYTGNKKWYSSVDWNRGYELKKTSKTEYEKWLVEGNEGEIVPIEECTPSPRFDFDCKEYYLHIPVVKISWVDVEGSQNSAGISNSYGSYDTSSLKDMDFDEAKKALDDVKSSADSKQAYQETIHNANQEAGNHQSNVDSIKGSAEYKNYDNSLDELKKSADYQDYGSSLENTKNSAEYQNYGNSVSELKKSTEYQNYANPIK
jgi:hypothetical protein